jgi:hypothetical protein
MWLASILTNDSPYWKYARTHADQSAAVVQDNTVTLETVAALAHHLGNTLIEGVTEGDVSDNAALEESPRPYTLGTVNDLVRDDEVAGLDLLLQTADGREGDYATDTDGAQSSDVGAGGNLMRGDLVVRAVAAEEGDGDDLAVVLTLVVQDGDG